MDLPLIAELAFQATRAGHPTLRLNYRGVGASAGAFAEGEARRDAVRAIEHLESTVGTTGIGLLGIGLGALVAASSALEKVGAVSILILVGPDPELLPATLPGFEGDLLIVASEAPGADALKGIVERAPRGRLSVIPHAGRLFQLRQGDLTRVVIDALAASF